VDAIKKISMESKLFKTRDTARTVSPARELKDTRRIMLLREMDRNVRVILANKCPDIEIRLSDGIVKLKKRIHFLNNKAIVSPESRHVLKQISVAFRVINTVIERDGKRLGLKPLRFEIAGHTHTSRAKVCRILFFQYFNTNTQHVKNRQEIQEQ
jgi:hypothetical protein